MVIDKPLNATERYLYGINIRLDAIIDMLSGLVEVYAKQNNMATTSNVVVEKTPTRNSRKKV